MASALHRDPSFWGGPDGKAPGVTELQQPLWHDKAVSCEGVHACLYLHIYTWNLTQQSFQRAAVSQDPALLSPEIATGLKRHCTHMGRSPTDPFPLGRHTFSSGNTSRQTSLQGPLEVYFCSRLKTICLKKNNNMTSILEMFI